MPVSKERLAELEERFHSNLGRSITAWSEVEEELFGICHSILGSTRERTSIVFYRLPALGLRFGLVDELVLSALPKRTKQNGGHDHADVKAWRGLKDEIETLLSTRTMIAHHPANRGTALLFKDTGDFVPVGEMVPIHNVEFKHSWWVRVSEAEALRGRHRKLRPLNTDELERHWRAVQSVARDISHFHTEKLKAHLHPRTPTKSLPSQ